MTELLKKAFEQARQLPEDAQNALAAIILEAIEEREWEKLLSSPRGQRTLDHLIAEACQQITAGEIEEGGFGL